MAKREFTTFIFRVTTSSGTTALVNLSDYIDTINGVNLEAVLQESHAAGDAWAEQLYTGLRRLNPVVVGGFYDDQAAGVATGGPHTLFGQSTDLGAERECEIDFGASDIVHFDYLLRRYDRRPTRSELTRFEAELQPTGAVTTAT